MRKRAIDTAIVIAGACAIVTSLSATGQAPAGGALPRTTDGHPDRQGYWYGGPVNASHSIEEGCCDPIHARMQSRGPDRLGLPEQLIIDPPDGRIPAQLPRGHRWRQLCLPGQLGAHVSAERSCGVRAAGTCRNTGAALDDARPRPWVAVERFETRCISVDQLAHRQSLHRSSGRSADGPAAAARPCKCSEAASQVAEALRTRQRPAARSAPNRRLQRTDGPPGGRPELGELRHREPAARCAALHRRWLLSHFGGGGGRLGA